MRPFTRRAALDRLGLGAMALTLCALAGRGAQAQPTRTIDIVARRFQFTPNQIPLKVGESVRLRIAAVDYAHGFNVPDLGVRLDLAPGMVKDLVITPQELGMLEFFCDNFCGEGHEGMFGHFIVTK